jgi:hypothetical protein
MLQVELNTISVSFIALGELVAEMHRFFVERGYIAGTDVNSCPVATPTKSFCDIMNQANQLYNKQGYEEILYSLCQVKHLDALLSQNYLYFFFLN